MDIRYFFFLSIICISGCTIDKNPLDLALASNSTLIQKVMSNPEKYEVQIIYTSVQKNEKNEIHLKRFDYRLDTTTYFYPASTVKMPVAFLAFQRIQELRAQGYPLTIHTPMTIDSISPPQSGMTYDSCSPSSLPSIASLVDQVFAISDNNAYNRLYEFLGQEYINTELIRKNIFTNSHITTRVGVGGFDRLENQYLNPITFKDGNQVILKIEGRRSAFTTDHSYTNTLKGVAYIEDGKKINKPFEMKEKNFINLADLERSLQHAVIPEYFPENERYIIDENDFSYLMTSMTKLPHDFICHKNNESYYDGYVKFFMYGDTKEEIPSHINIKNKVGVAYGYLTDCAYIEDSKNDIRFFLSATIHVNENKTYNDGVYEYDSIGIPFLAQLGREIYHYELKNKK